MFRSPHPNAFNYEDGLQWTHDGRAFVVNVRRDGQNGFDVWRVPMDGGQPTKLDIGVSNLVNSAIAVHPDGRQVSFLAGDPLATTASSPRREFRLLQLSLPGTTKRDSPGKQRSVRE